MPDITIPTGVQDFTINGKRSIKFNPRDPNVIYTLLALIDKVISIHEECEKKIEKNREKGKDLNYYLAEHKRMTEAIDSVYGDGFWNEAFDFVNPIAFTDDGLFQLECFACTVMDYMNDSIMDSLKKRNARVEEYTKKWKARGQAQVEETPTND